MRQILCKGIRQIICKVTAKRNHMQLVIPGTRKLPALFTPTPNATKRFVEFFTANIRNPNTRKAYTWAVAELAPPIRVRAMAAMIANFFIAFPSFGSGGDMGAGSDPCPGC